MDKGSKRWVWGCCGCAVGKGGGGLLKKAETDSARESYSSSPPLEDCRLPVLLPESMREKDREQKMERREGAERFAFLDVHI